MESEHKKLDYKSFDNISITAFRIITILNLLLTEPLNDEEINKKLAEKIEGSRYLSNDTICIYINTLRAIGCEISRPSKKNNYKYVLKYHPFKLNLSLDEINTILEIRKYISVQENWKLAVEIDYLFNQILNFISTESKKNFLSMKQTTLCREVNIDNILPEVNLLEKYCSDNRDLLIVYNSLNSGEKEIYLNAEKLTLENGSFYLWGFNYELNETLYLRLDRIKSMKVINICKGKQNSKFIEVLYRLSGNSALSFVPSENAIIIEKNDADNELIVLAKVKNKFRFFQDMLYFGPDCTILSPEAVKKEFICKLKAMAETHFDVSIS